MYLFEAVNPLQGLPKHWIKYLAERFGRAEFSSAGKLLGGEGSKVKELAKFDTSNIKEALKDDNVLAVIGRMEADPLFMIAKHYKKSTRYLFFETKPGKGFYDTKSTDDYVNYGRRKGYDYNDDYSLQEIFQVLEKIKGDSDFSNITVESIAKDPKRSEKVDTRYKIKNIVDPYAVPGYKAYSDIPYATSKQKDIIKKYASIKRPKLDAKVDEEVKKIKERVASTIDAALVKTITNVKQGYSFSVDKRSLGEEILKQVNLSPLLKLADAYKALETTWSEEDKPGDVARKLKQLGLQ